MKAIAIYILIWFVKYTRFWKYHNVPTLVIFAQAAHETGGFTSPVFRELNNLFGMNQPQKRKTTSLGNSGRKETFLNTGYATYRNWYQSIVDYFYRQREFKIAEKMVGYEGDTEDRYQHATADSNYWSAPDAAYITAWNYQIMKYQTFVYLSFLLPIILGALLIFAFSDNILDDFYKSAKRKLKKVF